VGGVVLRWWWWIIPPPLLQDFIMFYGHQAFLF